MSNIDKKKQTNKETLRKNENNMKKVEMITRDVLRGMSDGESVSMLCKDGYEMDSKKQLAYAFQKNENCKFSCSTDGMELSVTRTNNI